MNADTDSDSDLDARLRLAGSRWRQHHQDTPTTAASEHAAKLRRRAPDEIVPYGSPDRAGWRGRWVGVAAVIGVCAAVVAVSTTAVLSTRHAGSAGPGTTGDLIGVSWQVSAVSRDGTAIAVPAGRNGSLQLAHDGTFGANDGCNSSGGTARLTSTTMTLTSNISSQVACSDAFSRTVSEVLTGTSSWQVSGDELTVDHPGVGTLTFHASAPPGSPGSPSAS